MYGALGTSTCMQAADDALWPRFTDQCDTFKQAYVYEYVPVREDVRDVLCLATDTSKIPATTQPVRT